MKLSEQQKISEQHAEGIFAPMLSEGEESICTVNCAVKTSNMRYDCQSIPFLCYASCTSGGRLLLAVFGADIFEEYSAKAFEISLLKSLKIKKRLFGEYRINAEFPMGNRSIWLEISVSPKVYNGGFPNQEENLEKMLEVLRGYVV
ncbi:MAG: hypothetical protein K2G87_01025 [Oscillospiraceae bacterium]|nr:hypothetical protein [Oscillospiraceae bacterium]